MFCNFRTELKVRLLILFFISLLSTTPKVLYSQWNAQNVTFEFYGDTINLEIDHSVFVDFTSSLSNQSVKAFYQTINESNYQSLIHSLIIYKESHQLNDWFYYQLIRKTAQQISSKSDNYHRYTLYKWFLLTKSGYDATLAIGNNQLLFYVKSDDNIYDIPFYTKAGKQYVCLNYHDYGKIDFEKNKIYEVEILIPEATKSFSYKVNQLPNFRADSYSEKDIQFNYHETSYHFKVKLNPQVENIFANYPIVDFESYFNIPLSKETYSSLIPALKKNLETMNQKDGVDYLMHFTRYAFLFENDQDNFGKEKRLSPEQTLLYDHSDCDDRAALFFYLVKEIYNLPMIALMYPTHVTIAVQFNKPIGKPIIYKGHKYSICDPTPQLQDFKLGQLSPDIRKNSFQVVYEYNPNFK